MKTRNHLSNITLILIICFLIFLNLHNYWSYKRELKMLNQKIEMIDAKQLSFQASVLHIINNIRFDMYGISRKDGSK